MTASVQTLATPAIARHIARQAALRVWQLALVFVLACVVIVLRRPDCVVHPQFYAEDGQVWFAEANNLGWWQALLHTRAGYFQTFPRLGAALAQVFPFVAAPLVLNLAAVCMQALPVVLLLSAVGAVWGSLRFRAALAATYLALPNTTEVHAVLTNSLWFLALSAFLVIVRSASHSELRHSLAARIGEAALLLLCGLTGPFCIFLLPIALVVAWTRRKSGDRWVWIAPAILAVCSLIQACGLLLLEPSGRAHKALGATPVKLLQILGDRVWLSAILGSRELPIAPGPLLGILIVCAAAAGIVLTICWARKSDLVMRLFLAFTATVFVASLLFPLIGSDAPASAWTILAGVAGSRYWFYPTLAFAWMLVWGANRHEVLLRRVSISLLGLMCIGVVRDWRHPAFPDQHFADQARQFTAAPPGTVMTFPLYPQGWEMKLVKHSRGSNAPTN
jgi:hypothetical protein